MRKSSTKHLTMGTIMLYLCHRNRDAMRPNRHITPLFRFFGQWLKAGFRRFAEMVSFKLFVPNLAWHHPQLRSCPRRNSNRPSFLDEIWHLGKNKFIKPFSSPLQVLAVGGDVSNIGDAEENHLLFKRRKAQKNIAKNNN